MKTYEFPYGSGEWGSVISVELTDSEAATLEASMETDEYFHLSDDPALAEIEEKVRAAIFAATRQQLIDNGEDSDDEAVENELGYYHVCLPDAFDGEDPCY